MEGKYFEEVKTGDKFVSPARTITEADIAAFAGLSGDYAKPHTDEEWCKKTPFKKRMAHGMLTASIASGLFYRMGVFEGTGLAHLGATMRFTSPVYPGDTIHIECQIVDKKEMGANRGRVAIKLEVINQSEKGVMTEDMNIMVACKTSV